MHCRHDWIVVGEDTGGFVQWCQVCGAVKDSGGKMTLPLNEAT